MSEHTLILQFGINRCLVFGDFQHAGEQIIAVPALGAQHSMSVNQRAQRSEMQNAVVNGESIPSVPSLPKSSKSGWSSLRLRKVLFERSEFLIDTSQKKSLRVCTRAHVHACTRVRLLLVLVLGRQIVYGQNTVYLCLSKYIVFENTQL